MSAMVIHRGKPHLRSGRRSLLPEAVKNVGGCVARYGLIVLALLAVILVYLLISMGHVDANREPIVVRNATRVAFALALCMVIVLIGATLWAHRRWGWLVVLGAVAAVCLYLPAALVDRSLSAVWEGQFLPPSVQQVRSGLALQFLGSYNLASALSGAEQGETGQWLGQQIEQLGAQAGPDAAATQQRVRLLASLHLAARLVPILALVGYAALIFLFIEAAADVSAVAVGIQRGIQRNAFLPRGCPTFTQCDGPFRSACSIGARPKPKCWKTPGPLCPCQCTWLQEKVPGWVLGGNKECPDCPVYIDHQRDKFRLVMPAVIIISILVAFLARDGMANLIRALVGSALGAVGAASSPELMAQAQTAVLSSGLLVLGTIVALIFAVATVMRITEFAIFRLKL